MLRMTGWPVVPGRVSQGPVVRLSGQSGELLYQRSHDIIIPNSLSPGMWTQLALTFDCTADAYLFYVKGSLVVSSTAKRSQPTHALRISGGTSNFGHNFFFHGAVDEVSPCIRVLSVQDIAAIVGAGRQGKYQSPDSYIGARRTLLGGVIARAIVSHPWHHVHTAWI
jgi:hypothetical protein